MRKKEMNFISKEKPPSKMLKLKRAIIVEGKYDKIKLSSFVDSMIISTDGFRIFKNDDMRNLIRTLAKTVGIIILTDSDGAGAVIRNHIKSITNDGNVVNLYIPEIRGKEKRKTKASKEGLLGVEGIEAEMLKGIFEKSGVLDEKEKPVFLTRTRLYSDGLLGKNESSVKRKLLTSKLNIPSTLNTSDFIDAVNMLCSEEEYENILNETL